MHIWVRDEGFIGCSVFVKSTVSEGSAEQASREAPGSGGWVYLCLPCCPPLVMQYPSMPAAPQSFALHQSASHSPHSLLLETPSCKPSLCVAQVFLPRPFWLHPFAPDPSSALSSCFPDSRPPNSKMAAHHHCGLGDQPYFHTIRLWAPSERPWPQ